MYDNDEKTRWKRGCQVLYFCWNRKWHQGQFILYSSRPQLDGSSFVDDVFPLVTTFIVCTPPPPPPEFRGRGGDIFQMTFFQGGWQFFEFLGGPVFQGGPISVRGSCLFSWFHMRCCINVICYFRYEFKKRFLASPCMIVNSYEI